MQINERYRQLRGLLIHYKRGQAYEAEQMERLPKSFKSMNNYSRSCIYGHTVQKNPNVNMARLEGKVLRLCCWCEMPRPKNRTRWCSQGCVKAYSMAQGSQVVGTTDQSIISRRNCTCAKCGRKPQKITKPYYGPHYQGEDKDRTFSYWERFDIDHIVALSVAWERRDERGWLRAHMIDNLQFLCRDCHSRKSAEDRQILANLKAGRSEDWRPPPPKPKAKDFQMSLGLET